MALEIWRLANVLSKGDKRVTSVFGQLDDNRTGIICRTENKGYQGFSSAEQSKFVINKFCLRKNCGRLTSLARGQVTKVSSHLQKLCPHLQNGVLRGLWNRGQRSPHLISYSHIHQEVGHAGRDHMLFKLREKQRRVGVSEAVRKHRQTASSASAGMLCHFTSRWQQSCLLKVASSNFSHLKDHSPGWEFTALAHVRSRLEVCLPCHLVQQLS